MKLTNIIVASAVVALVGGGVLAGETTGATIKPLKIIKPLKAIKSTQSPTSLGLGGLGAGATAAAIIGGIVVIGVVVSSTSGT